MNKPDKAKNLLLLISTHLRAGRLRYSSHAEQRMIQRQIIRPEVEFVLSHGFHEKRKDRFNEEFNNWDYSVQGKTVDKRSLRIIVAFEDPNLLVVTTIDLDKG